MIVFCLTKHHIFIDIRVVNVVAGKLLNIFLENGIKQSVRMMCVEKETQDEVGNMRGLCCFLG